MEEYYIEPIIQNGCVLAEFRTCIYGLPQAGGFSYIKIVNHLAGDCYLPTGHTPGIFVTSHDVPILNLIVDDFGKYWPYNQYINKHYRATIGWHGEIFCVIEFKWDSDKKTVDLSMPNHFNNALARLPHYSPIKPQHSSHPYNAPICGQKRQFVIPTITNEKLTPAQLKHCQEFCVFYNYYT